MLSGWEAKRTALDAVTSAAVESASKQAFNKVHAPGVLAAPG